MRVCQMPEKDCYVEHLRRTHTKTMMKLKPRVEDMWSRTLTINGFSKAFSMTGHLSCTETLWSTLHLSNCSILQLLFTAKLYSDQHTHCILLHFDRLQIGLPGCPKRYCQSSLKAAVPVPWFIWRPGSGITSLIPCTVLKAHFK